MPDPQPEQQPRGVGRTLGLDRCQQVVHRLVLPAFAGQDFGPPRLQAEDVGGAFEPAKREKLVDGLLAQPLDVERGAGDEVLEPLGALRRANQPAGAAHIDLAFFGHRLAAAFGAVIRKSIGRALLFPGQVLDHLRDHVAGALDHHPVAGAHPQPRDLVAVVQGYVGDHHPAHGHRPQPPHRRQLAGTTDLDGDRLQHRFRPLGRELVRNRPARRLGDKTQPLLPVEPVYLVDHAVDIIGQIGAGLLDRAVVREYRFDAFAAHQQRRNRHTPGGNLLHHRELRFRRHRADRTPAMRQKAQGARCGYARILLPQRSCRSIAGIGEDLSIAFMLRSIKCGKILFRHVNFAADLENLGRCAVQHLRNIGDVSDIGGDIFAHLPVATGSRADQLPMLIAQRAR